MRQKSRGCCWSDLTATDGGNVDDDNDNGPLVEVAVTAGNRPEPGHLKILGPWQWTTPDAVMSMGRRQIQEPPREQRVFWKLRVF